jgi:hypothetical protein
MTRRGNFLREKMAADQIKPEGDSNPQWEEYCKYRDQAWEDINTSSDEFDKSLLTFSSGALGLSLAFIKDIVKLESAIALNWLYLSWAFLTSCIVLTIFSYRFSILAQRKHLDDLEKYYLKDDKTALNKKTVWSRALTICAWGGAIFFLAGVLATVVFVYLNVSQEHKMSNQKVTEGRAPLKMTPTVSQTTTLERGRAPLPMTPMQSQGTATPSAQTPPTVPATPIAPLKKD